MELDSRNPPLTLHQNNKRAQKRPLWVLSRSPASPWQQQHITWPENGGLHLVQLTYLENQLAGIITGMGNSDSNIPECVALADHYCTQR